MRIGILGGTGKEGAGLALRWAQAGHEIIIGSRDAERARAKAAELEGAGGPAPSAACPIARRRPPPTSSSWRCPRRASPPRSASSRTPAAARS